MESNIVNDKAVVNTHPVDGFDNHGKGSTKKVKKRESEVKILLNDWFSPLHYISDGSLRSKEALLKLKLEGIESKKGKWEDFEIKRLERNMDNFLKAYKLNEYSSLVYPCIKKDWDMRKDMNFILHMCQGIQRTRTHIRIKVESHFGKLKLGILDDDEKEQLFELQLKYGNKWKKIGAIMNRNRIQLSVIFKYLVKTQSANEIHTDNHSSDNQKRVYKPTPQLIIIDD